MVFMKEFYEKVDFEKNQQATKKRTKSYPVGQELTNPFLTWKMDKQ